MVKNKSTTIQEDTASFTFSKQTPSLESERGLFGDTIVITTRTKKQSKHNMWSVKYGPRPKRTFQKSRSSHERGHEAGSSVRTTSGSVTQQPAMFPLGARVPTSVLMDEKTKQKGDEDRQVDRQDVAAGFQFGPSAEVRHQEDTFHLQMSPTTECVYMQTSFTLRFLSQSILCVWTRSQCETTCKEPRDSADWNAPRPLLNPEQSRSISK